jgi:hypothetical protein
MKTTTLSFPELFLVAGTRAMLGAGIALLSADHLSAEQRRTAGFVLTAVGLLTTIPLVLEVRGRVQVPTET